ncbi:MAG: phosphotransferase [Aquamicrobium sp.]|uniref:aminoglycoside phosphotransferase family protein n=1 Tax=Aquamicrobium sp. TaxID=1872579 RepID=UPI00349ED12E|nr:phosphotransferase [Aquamicrobium sp.]
MEPPPCPAHWRIAGAVLVSDGIGGKVWRAERADGGPVALKQASPAALSEIDGAAGFLRWANGDGAVRLLERADDLLLLEWAGDFSLADHLERHGDDSATGIAAAVLQRLHAARDAPPPAALTPLHDIFAGLFLKAEGDRRAGRRTQFVEAAECAQALLSSQRDIRPLHGDVHHANILYAPRGWLAIDPKGLIGEPAFDAANLFCNPLEKDLRFREERALSMAAILSPALGCAAERLLDHAFAFSTLSAAWHIEDGDPEEAERSLAVGRAVRAARARLMS